MCLVKDQASRLSCCPSGLYSFSPASLEHVPCAVSWRIVSKWQWYIEVEKRYLFLADDFNISACRVLVSLGRLGNESVTHVMCCSSRLDSVQSICGRAKYILCAIDTI